MVNLTSEEVKERLNKTKISLTEINKIVSENVGKRTRIYQKKPFEQHSKRYLWRDWTITGAYKDIFTVVSDSGQKSSFQYIDVFLASHGSGDRFEFGVA